MSSLQQSFGVLLVLFLLNPCLASTAEISSEQATQQSAELLDSRDAFSQQYQFLSGKFQGQWVDAERFRHGVIIEDNPQKVVFANFRHENDYWIATLKKTAEVVKGYAHIVSFAAVPGVTAAHTQYRVVFAPGSELELVSQTTGETTVVNDLVVSAEAARPRGVPYNFMEGYNPNYARTKRLLSGAQRVQESLDNQTEQLELIMDSSELLQMTLNSINESHREGFSTFYGTLYPNCTTDLFASIDQILKLRGQQFEPFLTVFSNDPIAGPTRRGLDERGVLGERGPNLEDEILRGVTQYVASQVDQQMGFFPEKLINKLSFVLHVPEKNMQQVLASPIFKQVEKRLVGSLVEFLQSVLIMGQIAEPSAQGLMKGGLGRAGQILTELVSDMDKNLPPGTDTKALLYVSPYAGKPDKEFSKLLTGDLPARLPFKLYYAEKSKGVDDLLSIRQAPAKINQAFAEEAQRKSIQRPLFYLNSVVVQLHLKNGQSTATLQLLGGLTAQAKTLNKKEGKVTLRKIHSQRPDLGDRLATLVSAKYHHRLGDKTPRPIAVEFGRNLGAKRPKRYSQRPLNMVVDPQQASYGLFNLLEGHDGETHSRAQYVPYFEGEESYTPFGIDIDFPIFSFEMDPQTLAISELDIQVYKPTIALLEIESVKAQFKEALNKQLDGYKAKAGGGFSIEALTQLLGAAQ